MKKMMKDLNMVLENTKKEEIIKKLNKEKTLYQKMKNDVSERGHTSIHLDTVKVDASLGEYEDEPFFIFVTPFDEYIDVDSDYRGLTPLLLEGKVIEDGTLKVSFPSLNDTHILMKQGEHFAAYAYVLLDEDGNYRLQVYQEKVAIDNNLEIGIYDLDDKNTKSYITLHPTKDEVVEEFLRFWNVSRNNKAFFQPFKNFEDIEENNEFDEDTVYLVKLTDM